MKFRCKEFAYTDWTKNEILKKKLIDGNGTLSQDEFIYVVVNYLTPAPTDAATADEARYLDAINILQKYSKKYNDEIASYKYDKKIIVDTLHKTSIPHALENADKLLREKILFPATDTAPTTVGSSNAVTIDQNINSVKESKSKSKTK